MTRKQVLELLRDLIQHSGKSIPAENDPSGTFSEWVVDQEQLLTEIEKRLEEEIK